MIPALNGENRSYIEQFLIENFDVVPDFYKWYVGGAALIGADHNASPACQKTFDCDVA